MIVNAQPLQVISNNAPFQDLPMYISRSQQEEPAKAQFRYNEDASQILSLVLVGGPKWGFRIKLLNDNRVIVSRIDKGAAEKCGLKVNDELLSVNNVQLGNSPRSLLLQEYPPLDGSAGGGGGEKTPLLGSADDTHHQPAHDSAKLDSSDHMACPSYPARGWATAGAAGTGATAATATATTAVELSKLDFAYQLIKHSSISNKLMLTVKRFLNPAYGRASVAAATNSWHQHSPDLADVGQQAASVATTTYQMGQSLHELKRTAHPSAGYNCCDCYCDKEGE